MNIIFSKILYSYRTAAKNVKRGFTLVEMMITITIVAIIATVVIYNHQNFNDSLELTNLSYEVALILRQAQVYGVSVREFVGGTTEDERFGTPYGVFFDVNNSTTKKDIIFFADRNKDGKYVAAQDSLIEKTTIGRGNYVYDLCEAVNTNWICTGTGRSQSAITFSRPDPDAHIKMRSGGEVQAVKICLESPQKRKKEIVVYPTGQISIYSGTCENNAPVGGDIPNDAV
jgi:prepilin-type N-terminal cleavage/methylation domain-containing protein